MCGIAGIINLKGHPIEYDLLIRMNKKLYHRGPDDEGYVVTNQYTGSYTEFSGHDSVQEVRNAYPTIFDLRRGPKGTIGLAHRRFSIIDLTSGGHQPFFDTARTCCVVFNGEIYNYVEIRDELSEKGHIFRSTSDTEVIVEAYKAWELGCFAHLNGMWALALYDLNRKILILSRDRLGKEPLYWTKKKDSVYFASEIKALFEIPAVAQDMAVNEAAIYPCLTYGLRDLDNTTFFDGIYTLPAASWAVLNEDFPDNICRYWQVPIKRLNEKDISILEATNAIKDTLEDAVRIRLRADVPWCVELSGGMDSSSLVAIASQISGKQLTTYTVRFPERDCNEEPFARSIAHYYKTDYHIIDSPIENFWHEILAFTFLEEEPYHSPNLHTNQVIRRMMRAEGCKVVLNGAGGDEIFAGYGEYFSKAQTENLFKAQLWAYIDNALHRPGSNNKLKELIEPLNIISRHAAKKILCLTNYRRSHLNYIKIKRPLNLKNFITLSESLYNDITNTKIPYWMRSGDKTHMGIPLEGRMPFLDYRMIELTFKLPTTYLIRHGWHKWILRKALADILPADVAWRKNKMGFPFPYKRFFCDSREIIQTIIRESRNPYLDLSQPEVLSNNWYAISFLLWYELYFNGNRELFDTIVRLGQRKWKYMDYGFQPLFLTL